MSASSIHSYQTEHNHSIEESKEFNHDANHSHSASIGSRIINLNDPNDVDQSMLSEHPKRRKSIEKNHTKPGQKGFMDRMKKTMEKITKLLRSPKFRYTMLAIIALISASAIVVELPAVLVTILVLVLGLYIASEMISLYNVYQQKKEIGETMSFKKDWGWPVARILATMTLSSLFTFGVASYTAFLLGCFLYSWGYGICSAIKHTCCS